MEFPEKLPRAFYDRESDQVARELLGCSLVHAVAGVQRVGRIVETEAYLGPHDLAAYSSKGITPGNRLLFGPPGYAFLRFIYGMHWCLNVVTGREGYGAAVLLRALEPVRNLEPNTAGPALLCRAMGIDGSLNGHDMLSDDLFIAPAPAGERHEVVARPRIGVAYAGAWAHEPLRFYIEGNRFVSKP